MRAIVRSTWVIVAVFASSRLLAVMIACVETPFRGGVLTQLDVALYAQWAEVLFGGVFPQDDQWQYPPLAAAVFMLGSVVPPNPVGGFMVLAFAVDAVAMAALLVAAKSSGRYAGAWLWACAALVVGPVFLTRFDVFPAACAVVGLLVMSRRPVWGGALLGVGAALKVWPVLAMASVRRASLPRAVAGFVLAFLAGVGVMWLWFGSEVLSFVRGQSERGLQMESVAALPFLIARALGADIELVLRYGSVEIDAAGAGFAATIATVVGVAGLGAIAVARLLGGLEGIPSADVAFAAVALSVVTSRVFSPQYSIWLLAAAAACLAASRTLMRVPIALVVLATIISQAIFPPLYSDLSNGEPGATALQAARIGLMVAATVLAGLALVLGYGRAARHEARAGRSKGLSDHEFPKTARVQGS